MIFIFAFLQSIAAQNGVWQNIGSSGVVCLATALLPNSRLLCYERPHMPPYEINPYTSGVLATEIDLQAEVGPDGSWKTKFTPKPISNNPFCSGLAEMADGSILVVGGDNQAMPSVNGQNVIVNGRRGLRTYTPCPSGAEKSCTGTWKILPDMSSDRWYPTVVALPSGDAIIIGGHTKNIDFDHLAPTDDNPYYEYYPPKEGIWPKKLDILQWAFPHNLYAPSFLLPSGRVFILVSNRSIIIDPKDESITHLPDLPPLDHSPWIYPHTPSMFVMPMTIANGFEFRLMICGGSKLPRADGIKDASNVCLSIKPDEPSDKAKWVVEESMPVGRLMPDSVLLPDGSVLMVNGLLQGQAGGNQGQVQYAQGPIYQTDLFKPNAPSGLKWSTIGQATNKRLYHSGALLLESGHVVTVGSEFDNYDDFYNPQKSECFEDVKAPHTGPKLGPGCTDPFNYNIERFTPPYLMKGPGPVITKAPSTVTYGSLIEISVKSTAGIARATLIRYSSLTHSTNTDQRFIELIIKGSKAAENKLYISFPENSALAPPGNWMLFLLNENGVPSTASSIMLKIGKPDIANFVIVDPEPKTKPKTNDTPVISWFGTFIASILSFFFLA